jgi:pilus assembly protein CpaB
MKRRPLLIGLAVLLAVIGTVAVYAYVHSADRRALNGVKTTSVLVATKAIPAGTPWSQVTSGGYATTEQLPESGVPASALTSTGADVPAAETTTFGVQPGQVLVREMFAAKSAATGAIQIPGKLQAITIALPASADVGGFVQNGSEVAVYSIFQTAIGGAAQTLGQQRYGSKLLLPRVTVLAVNTAAPSTVSGTSGTTSSASAAGLMVTLAVTQQQAERVAVAQKLGDLYLTLLSGSSSSAEDGGTIGTGSFSPTELFTR